MELERLKPHLFDQFREFIYAHSGIRIDEKKVTLLSNRIRRRLKVGDFASFHDYYRFLTSPDGTGELEGFLDAITTNETFFFRTEKQFDWLREVLITELVAQHRAGQRAASLRIWSAGCANGAEPFSIAICLAENLYRLSGWSLKIIGTDISEQMLRAARIGTFTPRAIKAVSESQRRRYFQYQADNDSWQVRSSIAKLVDFRKHNLMQPWDAAACDCIFIRNVLIYFDRDSKQVALKHLINALAPGGYLVVGPSEGVYDMLNELERISPLVFQKVDNTRSGVAPTQKDGQR